MRDDLIHRLAAFKSRESPVVTLYVDLDGKRWPRYQDIETRVERLLRQAADRLPADGHAAAAADFKRIESTIRGGFDRSATRGLAIFACGSSLWEVVELPVAVKDQLVVNQTPHIRQLETVFESNRAFCVLLADRQRARLFLFDHGELVDKTELFDALPRHDDDAGDRDRRHDRHKLETAASQHLRKAAGAAFAVWKDRPFEHLIIGAPDDIANQLERELHTYLQERIVARLPVPPTATEADIRAAALAVEEQVERAKEAAAVAKVRAAAASGRAGVVGLDAVLATLAERRVENLIVSEGYEAPGWSCGPCRLLAVKGASCPSCSRRMEKVDDVVEAAVEEALLQSCHVEMCVDNADLDVLGRIGALLRF